MESLQRLFTVQRLIDLLATAPPGKGPTPPASLPLLLDEDPTEYKDLLANTVVGTRPDVPPVPARTESEHFSQGEIINRVIERLLGSKDPPANVLTFGYRKLNGRHLNSVVGTFGVENYFPNTVVNYLKSLNGMTYLLTVTFMFAPLSNGCFFQLTGEPLYDVVKAVAPTDSVPVWLKPAPEREEPKKPSLKRKRNHIAPRVAVGMTVITATTAFARSKIFYARPCNGAKGKVDFGLPKYR
ncbi:hypothetical protein HK101_011057 [Irineochytrium annulatum]|nr:hypothetical protein HK101_011057 [Irineochytrium annulatum]